MPQDPPEGKIAAAAAFFNGFPAINPAKAINDYLDHCNEKSEKLSDLLAWLMIRFYWASDVFHSGIFTREHGVQKTMESRGPLHPLLLDAIVYTAMHDPTSICATIRNESTRGTYPSLPEMLCHRDLSRKYGLSDLTAHADLYHLKKRMICWTALKKSTSIKRTSFTARLKCYTARSARRRSALLVSLYFNSSRNRVRSHI